MNRKIAVFGAQKNLEQFIKRAVLLGYELYGFASGDNNPCVKYFKEFYNISFTETDQIIRICQKKGIEGVTSFSLESALPYVIKVSQTLGFTSNSLHHAQLINDKYIMRECMDKYGVHSPAYMEAASAVDIQSSISKLQFPLIVKPIDGGGSRGVTKVMNNVQLEHAIEYAKRYSRRKMVIIEQFIEGREFSVEYISHNGKHYFLQITDKVTEPQHFIEVQHHQPAVIPPEIAQTIRTEVEKCLTSLEITDSPSHTEVMWNKHDNQIYVIECGPRMGGDNIQANLVRLSTGYDMVEGALELCCGHFLEPQRSEQHCSGIYFIMHGTEFVAEWLQQHKDDPRIMESEYAGYISANVQNNGERDGYFIYQANEKLEIL